jgi:hypothetical protein
LGGDSGVLEWAGTQGDLGPMATKLWLQDEEAGERGPGEQKVLGAKQEVSHVAGKGVELTKAIGTKKRNGGHRTGSGPRRASRARAERDRGRGCSAEGATERGRASECVRAPEKARARGGMVGKHTVVGATTAESAGGSGGRGAVPTGGAHGTERVGERTGTRADERGPRDRERRLACVEKTGADKSVPSRNKRERQRAWDGADRRGPPVREGQARVRDLGRAGPDGLIRFFFFP